jgi:hypothetical protein
VKGDRLLSDGFGESRKHATDFAVFRTGSLGWCLTGRHLRIWCRSLWYLAEIGYFVEPFTGRRVRIVLTSCGLLSVTSGSLFLSSRQDTLGSGIITSSIGSGVSLGLILLWLLLLLDLLISFGRVII